MPKNTPTDKKKRAPNEKPTKKPGRQKTRNKTAALEALQKNAKATRDKYSQATKTSQAYSGYLARAKAILMDIIAERRQKVADDPDWACPQGIDTDLLEKAFDNPPNKYSAIALELVLTQKCITEGLGKSTAEGLHGAFAKYWDSMDGDKYAGDYHYDETTETVTGCPARAGIVASLVKVIKIRSVAKGAAATRNHAEAMTAEDMTTVMDWSESVCPTSKVADAVKAGVAPSEVATSALMVKHAMMRAFASSGHTLWTRNFEACGLQYGDLTMDCIGPLPFKHSFFKVFLDGRKGWQHKQGYDGTRESNTYEIYPQPDTPALDMYKHLLAWIPFYELCIGRKLEADDYIFPYLAPNGVIHPKREMTLQLCQDLITEFTQGAGLLKTYTTHCFRRGGAQYRFMFAPLGKRWSLSIVRWWGGWATGEHVDTLMRYLLDSLQSYETGHGDALCPVPREADQSFMGDHLLVQPVPTAEFRSVTSQIITQLGNINIHASHLPCACSIASTNVATNRPLLPVVQVPQSSSPAGAAPTDGLIRGTPGNPPDRQSSSSNVNGTPGDSMDSRGLPLSKTIKLIPGVWIPDLKKGDNAWREAVCQWEEGVPAQQVKPLRDWPKAWYSDGMRNVTGTKRTQRKLIAEEYERLGRSDTNFRAEYPTTYNRIGKLLPAIQESNKRRGVTLGRRSKKRAGDA